MDEERAADDGDEVQRAAASQPVHRQGGLIFEEFEEGDPRRGPHLLDILMEAEVQAQTPGRWHRQKRHVDWFAIRLTVGRGYAMQQAGRMFGVGDSHIANRARNEEWVFPMAESDRRELAVLVWLAGVKRLPRGDESRREALKTASDWRPKQTTTHPVWREKNRLGEPLQFTINEEIPRDAFFSDADPKRDERRAVVDKLEAKLAELEAQWEREYEQEYESEGEGAEGEGVEGGEFGAEEALDQDPAAEGADQADVLGDVLGQSAGGGEGVAGMGPAEPASA